MLHPSLYIFLISSSQFISKIPFFPINLSIMMVKKVEIKVDINCEKCKNQIMQAVTELQGVNQVALDQEKSLLTVVGTMDPVCVVQQLIKIKQKPVVVSVGPPKPPEPKPETKPEWCKPCLPYCNTCDIVTVSTYENGSSCTIV